MIAKSFGSISWYFLIHAHCHYHYRFFFFWCDCFLSISRLLPFQFVLPWAVRNVFYFPAWNPSRSPITFGVKHFSAAQMSLPSHLLLHLHMDPSCLLLLTTCIYIVLGSLHIQFHLLVDTLLSSFRKFQLVIQDSVHIFFHPKPSHTPQSESLSSLSRTSVIVTKHKVMQFLRYITRFPSHLWKLLLWITPRTSVFQCLIQSLIHLGAQ